MKFKKFAVKMVVSSAVLILALILFFVYFTKIRDALFYTISLFAPFILAYIVSLPAIPLADKLQKKLKLPEGLTAILVIVLLVGIVGGALTGVIWKIVSEIKDIYTDLPQIVRSVSAGIERMIDNLSAVYNRLPVDIRNTLDSVGENISGSFSSFINNNYKPVVSGAGTVAKALPSIFVSIIVFILSLYFMIANGKQVNNFMGKLIGQKFANKARQVMEEMKKYLGGYVKAQLIIMSVAFVIIIIGLSILKIRYSMLIAIGIAILDALPFFGSGAVLWPWSIISFINGDIRLGIGLIIIYLAIIFTRQMIEPKIVSSSIGVNPILTLMSMYLGYKIFSLGGMILGPVILILIVSFYKAGAFDGLISFTKKFIAYIKTEIKELFNFITMK